MSDDYGETFTYLARAFGNSTTSLDFGEHGYSGRFNAVKIVWASTRAGRRRGST